MPLTIEIADPDSLEARACLTAYFDLLLERIPNVQRNHVPDPDPHAGDFRPPSGLFLLARIDGRVVGCGCFKEASPGIVEIKRLWVDPAARGQGVARRLMAELESAARQRGHTSAQLDTNDALGEAISLYRRDGWTDIPPYSAFPATCWLGKRL